MGFGRGSEHEFLGREVPKKLGPGSFFAPRASSGTGKERRFLDMPSSRKKFEKMEQKWPKSCTWGGGDSWVYGRRLNFGDRVTLCSS